MEAHGARPHGVGGRDDDGGELFTAAQVVLDLWRRVKVKGQGVSRTDEDV